ncbi:MAG: beta-galactosidase trimerization domain-containing protein, partial [Gemmatimonadota bacterium]|nr:beta-galactosidase trimerization domain-containing protein [Gemmatimonadota bacterium]
IRSLNKDMIIVSPTWGIDQKGVARLWYQFLHNDHGVIFWDNDKSRHKFIEKADGSLTSRAKVFQQDLHELRGGLGKLILGSERLHDRIAVLYSHPSIRVHWMLQYLNLGREWILRESFNEYRELNFNRLRMALLNLIEDHFLQYDFISYVQLAQGKLDRGEYDLLFLPRTIVISDVEAAAIERFVERGGTVVADCLCGLMDESGKARPGGGALDKIFGFRSLEGAAGVLNRVSATVAETVNLGGVPALVNHYGRGKAIYLDRSISEYYLQRQEPGTDTELFSLFSGVFEASGISYPAKITFQDGSRLPGTELIRYRNGDRTVLSLHRNPLVRVVGVGGTEKVDNAAFEKVETVRLILPDTCHVYDLRKGKYLGHSDNFTFQFDPWRPSVLTLSSEKLAPPVVHPEDFTLTLIPGQPVVFELKLSPLNSTCSTRKNVVSVKVTGPDSRRLYHYEDNISFTGDTYRFTLSLAVNDQEGEYTVTFRDASTGFSTSIRLQTAK